MYTKIDNFFTESECDQIMHALKPHENEFKSVAGRIENLGTGYFGVLKNNNFAPMDAIKNYKIKDYNGIWHDILLNHMSELFGDVRYLTKLAKPGFNKVDVDSGDPCIWHYDSEKTVIPYFNEEIFSDYTHRLSYFDKVFTFTVMISDGDFTFDFYPQTVSEYIKPPDDYTNTPCIGHLNLLGDECPNPDCPLGANYETIHYKKGTLILQDVRMLHRKGRSVYTANQPRISIQGHGVEKDGVVYLHW